MAALGAQTIASSYEQLLHTDTDGGGNGNTLVTIKDGDNGTTFGIKLATNKVEVIPGSNDANAFEVSQADGTAVFTVNTSSPAFTLTGNATITTADNTDTLTLISTDADANSGPNLRLYRNSANPADSDVFGQIEFEGRNDNSQDFIATQIKVNSGDVSDGTEDAQIEFDVMTAGTLREYMRMASGSAPSVVFNEDSQDIDFRVESNGNANMLFVDGGNDRVGIGTASPDSHLHIKESSNGTNAVFHLEAAGGSGTENAIIRLTNPSDAWDIYVEDNTGSGDLRFYNGADRVTIEPGGNVGIGTTAPTAPLHIKAAPINTSGSRSAQLYIEDTTAFGSTQNSGIQFRQEWQSGSVTSTSAIVGTRTSTSSGNYGGALIFQTRANGGDLADNMIIQDDGDVGIGTTSPAVELDVHGGSEIVAGFGRADDANAYVSVRTDNVQNKICGYSFNRKTSTPTGVGSTDTLAYIHSNVKNATGATNAAGDLQFITNSGGSLGTRMSINKGGGVSIIGDFHDSSTSDPGNYQIAFGGDSTSAPRWGFRVSTSSNDEDLHLDRNLSGTSTPCMTWDKNNGNVGIGTTSPSQTLDVESNANTYVQEIRNEHGSTPYGLIINFGSADPNTTNYPFIAGSATGTDRFKIYSDGSYSDISDEREKENIKDTESQLANINKLEIKNYNRINDKSKGDHIGVVAQQIEPIYPHLVRTSDDEQKTKMVYKIGLIAPLIKAVQELSAQNDALTARIEALESA